MTAWKVPPEAIALGNDHFFTWYTANDCPLLHAGIIEYHYDPEGELCMGSVNFWVHEPNKYNRPLWQVQSWAPLSITPSILCKKDSGGCGMHGFITNGIWVPA